MLRIPILGGFVPGAEVLASPAFDEGPVRRLSSHTPEADEDREMRRAPASVGSLFHFVESVVIHEAATSFCKSPAYLLEAAPSD
jgi:hypothetical protein